MAEQKPRETTEAKEAFAQYVALGPGRSLQKLAERRVAQQLAKNTASALVLVKRWSSQHNWQDRIGNAATERSDRMLRHAAEIDAETFFLTSEKLQERVRNTNPADSQVLVQIRESVRKAIPKGATSVSVNVSVEVRQLAEQLAKSLGVSADELIQEAEEIASGAWGES